MPIEEIVRHVQERFDATGDFTADVQQELVVISTNRTFKGKGTVAFKRPGRMRWALTTDEEQIIIADGTTLWVYQPEEQQVLKSPFQSAFRSSSPISFLTGVGRIDRDFVVTLDGREEGRVHLLLVPRADEGEIGRLRLTIETKAFDIVGAEIRDPLGNVTKLVFSNLRRNLGLEDAFFRFEVPPGVDIIEAPVGY
jgi:outer membrane lipoprotein carrier protein